MRSPTSAPLGSRSSDISSGGLPAMPRLVALARSAAPSSASARWSHGTTFTTGPTASAISFALSSVRLATRISFAPCAARLAITARAAPPAPSTTMGPLSGRHFGSASRRLWMNPLPSLLNPVSVPSFSTTTVLTAPMRRASSSTRSSSGMTACLCGVVTLQPRKPRTASPGSAIDNFSEGTGSSTYLPAILCSSSQ